MTKPIRNALLLCLLVPLAGCAKKGLQGKWRGTLTKSGITANVNMDFKDNGQFSQQTTAQGPRGSVDIQQDGTYKVEGESVVMTPTGGSFNGRPIPAGAQKMSETEKFHVDGDSMTLSGGSDTVNFNRVK